jgi:hypothetical protein
MQRTPRQGKSENCLLLYCPDELEIQPARIPRGSRPSQASIKIKRLPRRPATSEPFS